MDVPPGTTARGHLFRGAQKSTRLPERISASGERRIVRSCTSLLNLPLGRTAKLRPALAAAEKLEKTALIRAPRRHVFSNLAGRGAG